MAEGRNVKVAVGCPEGVFFLDTVEEWEDGITVDQVRNRLLTRAQAALWIETLTTGQNERRTKSGKSSKRNGVSV